ncbi:MAG: carbamoyl-phosphate synthase large subunit, partial [Halobacteriovoraceae bacterium]|nr:carbamoyl-phosphate synthase large subunit [Halobacteriovoraceae bacterium]
MTTTQANDTFNHSIQKTRCYLHFEDGTSFEAWTNLPEDHDHLIKGIWGEAAFTTGMSGYQETMTDPSFLGQHIIFSTAHVGNYESTDDVLQSKKSHATALIARNFSPNKFLNQIIADQEIPLVHGLDTRALVKFLVQAKCSHKSVITPKAEAPSQQEFDRAELKCNDLSRVSLEKPEVITPGDSPIVLVDYGCKRAIQNYLKDTGFPLVVVPHNTKSDEILKYNPRLIFLSNGPGDPRAYQDQIQEVKNLLGANVPLRGICLGHQLLSLALGAEILKMPFGQRGMNHPVLEHETGEILITSQNHGYATDENSLNAVANSNPLNKEIYISHRSLFDQTVAGMATTDHFLRSVQFHPEANPGPTDAYKFFEEVHTFLEKGPAAPVSTESLTPMLDIKSGITKDVPYKKILLIGSGPIKIGQASEFDYSGTQACKSLKEIGIDVVLLNSNPATIMTDRDMAYRTYIEPITKETIKKIIDQENVDAVLSTMGGQTALNMCIELEEDGWLSSKNVDLLGARVDTIKKTEDRDLFAKELAGLGYQTGKRFHAKDREEGILLASSKVGYPLIIRRDFALGGKGAALVHNEEELKNVFSTTDVRFPITMEKSLLGWKEVELEVMVDKEKNGVIICSIENIDPCGIHTGDSITVAPAQTISDRCYQQMRKISLHVAKHMGVVAGGANVQFAVNPTDENDIVVIEMNPRVSRSSALASKATGYPIAKISALLAVGYTLREILNDITKASPVAFEPTLDYVAIKIPIFPFNKFPTSSQVLGPQMRSVGEVLALGGSFNEAFLKALRSLEMGLEIPSLAQLKNTPIDMDLDYIKARLKEPKTLCLLTCLEAIRLGMTVKEITSITKITPWFLEQMEEIKHFEDKVQNHPEKLFYSDTMKEAKRFGLSDKYLAFLTDKGQKEILAFRFEHKIFPIYKAVDTCSGEFPAQTPYFYSTYSDENEALPWEPGQETIAIMGSGPNRIGQGIEFDYSCVKACQRVREKGSKAIMINSNPETVSTDYDSSDRLYLSPLFSEDLFDIFLNENPKGIIASFSGQTGIGVREHIEKTFRADFKQFNFLGPSLDVLEQTEDRKLFAQVTKKVDLSHTKAIIVQGYKNLVDAMTEIGMPVIIRPSYVIGGESMYIFYSHDDINELPESYKNQLKNSNAVFQIENYLEDALEYDVDLIRDKEGNCVFTVCEHIEHAGVHSGDSGMISPPVVLTSKLYDKMKKISEDLAHELDVIGPINFQYAVKEGEIYCIEANPRGSRTLPFLSKAYDISLPQIATDAMLGEIIQPWHKQAGNFFAVKQSTFPFDRFLQDNIILGPKMRSTGETMGLDRDKEKAILKSYLGNYPKLDKGGKILISLADKNKEILLPYLKTLGQIGLTFIATPGTAEYIKRQGIPCETVAKLMDGKEENIVDALKDDSIRMVFNTPKNTGASKSDGEIIRNNAIAYGIPCFTRKENIKAV